MKNKISELKRFCLPEEHSIHIENLSFSYDGSERDYVLNDICLKIPQNKVTAIVGASGSGKTTLVKLMLGFYEPNQGSIKIGNLSLKNVNPHFWRSITGSVLQVLVLFFRFNCPEHCNR